MLRGMNVRNGSPPPGADAAGIAGRHLSDRWSGLVTDDQAFRVMVRFLVTGDHRLAHDDQPNLTTVWSGFWSGSCLTIPTRRSLRPVRRRSA